MDASLANAVQSQGWERQLITRQDEAEWEVATAP
jgi:hypothetical protein